MNQRGISLIGKTLALHAWVSGSIPLSSTKYAPMTELVYVSVLEAEFWEFESLLGHQVLGYLQQQKRIQLVIEKRKKISCCFMVI